jgi:hypothetical protein
MVCLLVSAQKSHNDYLVVSVITNVRAYNNSNSTRKLSERILLTSNKKPHCDMYKHNEQINQGK